VSDLLERLEAVAETPMAELPEELVAEVVARLLGGQEPPVPVARFGSAI
jgi:hypothetical protein